MTVEDVLEGSAYPSDMLGEQIVVNLGKSS